MGDNGLPEPEVHGAGAGYGNGAYDHLNRLTQAQEGPTTGGSVNWTQTYGYDVLGNFWVSSNTGLPSLGLQTPQSSSWYSTTVPNRFAASTGWTYDSNGNVLQVGQMARSFTYDGENRQVTACLNCAQGSPTATYQYDGMGERVSKTTGGAVTTYVYDAFGNLAAEYSTGAMPSACGTPTCYVTADHLGSTRMLTSSAGAVGSRYDYQPFGQEIPAGYDGRLTSMGYLAAADATNPKFTGQERDQETTLDNFLVRYYDPAQGRFQSPDPGNVGADPGNPQSWNMYGYVANNPLSFVDPSGESFWSVLGGIFSGLGTFLATGNPVLGAEVGLGVSDTVDSLQHGQFPLAGLLDFAGIAGTGFLGNAIGNANSGPWNELPPIGGMSGGGTFGSGNTSPYVFSLQPGSQSSSVLDDLSDFAAGAGDLLTTIPFTHSSITGWVRKHTPGGDPTDPNSGFYNAGRATAIGLGVVDLAAGGVTVAAIADGKYGAYFGRASSSGAKAVFNQGPVRFGWYWDKTRDAIGLRIGAARGTNWWSHIPFWHP